MKSLVDSYVTVGKKLIESGHKVVASHGYLKVTDKTGYTVIISPDSIMTTTASHLPITGVCNDLKDNWILDELSNETKSVLKPILY